MKFGLMCSFAPSGAVTLIKSVPTRTRPLSRRSKSGGGTVTSLAQVANMRTITSLPKCLTIAVVATENIAYLLATTRTLEALPVTDRRLPLRAHDRRALLRRNPRRCFFLYGCRCRLSLRRFGNQHHRKRQKNDSHDGLLFLDGWTECLDRKSIRLNSSKLGISDSVFC